MATIVIDEDIHRSISEPLKRLGHRVMDIRDYGLRGSEDEEIFQFAQHNKAVLLSGDLGFSNILRFPLGTHWGIIIIKFPNEMSTEMINEEVYKSLNRIKDEDMSKNLTVISPGKVRIRRRRIS
jgi:predicted nuclease of predicted toxin-antitoxin system